MRLVLALSVLVALSGCVTPPSPSERAFLSASNPPSAQVRADVRAILRGMESARDNNERVAGWTP